MTPSSLPPTPRTGLIVVLLSSLLAGCQPVRRADACKEVVSALSGLSGHQLVAKTPEDFLQAADDVHATATRLMKGSSKEEAIEALRPELLSNLEALESALRKAAHHKKRQASIHAYGIQKSRVEQLVGQLGGLALRLRTACH